MILGREIAGERDGGGNGMVAGGACGSACIGGLRLDRSPGSAGDAILNYHQITVPQISTVESNILDYRQIRTRRESAGLSQTELARQAGIGRSTLYLIEDGLLDTRVSTLLKIADALKISPARLLGLRREVV